MNWTICHIVFNIVEKPLLEPTELKNCRPVSNLTFVSKNVERIRRLSSIESSQASVAAWPHIGDTTRQKQHYYGSCPTLYTLLPSLYLCSASWISALPCMDCVDCCRPLASVIQPVMGRIVSDRDRSNQVCYNGHFVNYIVSFIPSSIRGRVVGPCCIYCTCKADVFHVIADCLLVVHWYADKTRIYVSLYWAHWTMDGQETAKPGQDTDHLDSFTSAVGQCGCCRFHRAVYSRNLAVVRLRTSVPSPLHVWLATEHVGPSVLHMYAAPVSSNCGSYDRYDVRWRTSDVKTLIHAFINSRLDYCNSLAAWLRQRCTSLRKLHVCAKRPCSFNRQRREIWPLHTCSPLASARYFSSKPPCWS